MFSLSLCHLTAYCIPCVCEEARVALPARPSPRLCSSPFHTQQFLSKLALRKQEQQQQRQQKTCKPCLDFHLCELPNGGLTRGAAATA